MQTFKLFVGILIGYCALDTTPVFAQSGDQILDGIGENLPVFPETTPQLYNEFLTSVQDIQVETVVGVLPGLPRYVKGVYSNNFKGPDVRVL